MAGLLYYLPGKDQQVNYQDLLAAGLGHAFERTDAPRGVRLAIRGVTGGPGGSKGVVVADDRHMPTHLVAYHPQGQTWRKVPQSDAHVGYYDGRGDFAAMRPKSADLVRETLLPGHFVTLGDGQAWVIPVARGMAHNETGICGWYQVLPQATTVDDEGHWKGDGVLPRYARLWEIAQRWWDALAVGLQEAAEQSEQPAQSEQPKPVEQPDGTKITFDFEGINDAALTALATNYRLGKAEVALLGLFNDRVVREILNALVDWPTLEEWSKKKAQDVTEVGGSLSSAGLGVGIRTTAPA